MAKVKEDAKKELSESLAELEKEKNISKDSMLGAVSLALVNAYKSNFKEDNVEVDIDSDTFETNVFSVKTAVDEVLNPVLEIALDEARLIDESAQIGSEVKVKIDPKSFGRISVTNAKNQISQKIREEEKQVVFNEFATKKGSCVTGKVGRIMGKNIAVNLGAADALLTDTEQVQNEHFKVGDFIKVYVLDVTMSHKGPRILVSRTHKELVRGLFAEQVPEIEDGTVEIKAIARESGSRSKIAVYSNDPSVDPVGACVGMNTDRVDSVVNSLFGEKIDIIVYDENPAYFIENALSPAKVIFVVADPDEKRASVVVPDYQLSLAIGREGQNARLAARLTGYKIDIKSESQAREAGELPEDYDQMIAGNEFNEEEEYSDDYFDDDVEYSDDYSDDDVEYTDEYSDDDVEYSDDYHDEEVEEEEYSEEYNDDMQETE